MRKRQQTIESAVKQLGLATFLWWGLCVSAIAQTPSFSPPSLPPLPGLPALAAPPSPAGAKPPAAIAPVATPVAPIAPNAAQALPALTLPGVAEEKPAVAAKTAAAPLAAPSNALADLPPPQPEATDGVSVGRPLTVASPAPDLAPPLGLPNLALPVPPVASTPPPAQNTTPNFSLTPLPAPLSNGVGIVTTALPSEAPKQKTWKTRLAPTVIPPTTTFNYRRQILPPTISRAAYDAENQHLPVAYSREDYERLLVNRAAANDVEATRALLNRGTGVNADSGGETPLAAARRAGARDTERLLIARGGR